ncbi:hypothetical protein EYC84_002748 [Monilinia fructicola]|nr:hypothetical protein EYC84_002748 [Monilinia fructicola]
MVEEVRTGGSWFGPPDASPEPRRVEKKKKKKKVEKRDDVKLCIVILTKQSAPEVVLLCTYFIYWSSMTYPI